MRILNGKNRLKSILKRSFLYIVVCYLLASWGVNGVINPMHYYRNAVMHEEEIIPLEEETFITIDLTDDTERFEYLSFAVSESKNIYFDMKMSVSAEETTEMVVEVHQGINTVKVPEGAEAVHISKDVIQKNEAVLGSYVLSAYPKVDSEKMIEIMLSMLLLLAFWEGIQYIKNRYTK